MAQNHEYALLDGVNRSTVGRYIFVVAAGLSSGLTALLIAAINWLEKHDYWQFPQVVSAPLTAGVVYLGLYYCFRYWVWKWKWVAKLIHVPDLSGVWEVEGKTLNPKSGIDPAWVGKLTVSQDWDLIRVSLQTGASRSESIAAALQHDAHYGYHLLYTYRNEPKANSPTDMAEHRGAVHLTFSADLMTAEGDYFNGRGRYTFGVMSLKRPTTV